MGMTVSGLLVLCRPEDESHVCADLSALGWATVHLADAAGRIVLTIEAASTVEAVARHLVVHSLPRVISAALVEHYVGDCVEQQESHAQERGNSAPPEMTK